MFQPLYIGAYSVTKLVGTPFVQTRSRSVPRNSAPILSLDFHTLVIFESYPTKM